MFHKIEPNKSFHITSLNSAFEETYNFNYSFVGESHDFWEIVIVLSGKIGVTAGSDVLMLKKGQAIIHEPMEFHRLWSEDNSEPTIIIFSFCAENFPQLQSKLFGIKDLAEPKRVLDKIQNCFTYADEYYMIDKMLDGKETESQIAIKSLELFILNTVTGKLLKDNSEKSRSAINYSNIVDILENNLDKSLSVAEIAELCHMSEVNVKKTFSKYLNIGVINYYNNLKINAAVPMLKAGMTVRETAEALGFSNQNYFSTVFKRITGHTPSEFR